MGNCIITYLNRYELKIFIVERFDELLMIKLLEAQWKFKKFSFKFPE